MFGPMAGHVLDVGIAASKFSSAATDLGPDLGRDLTGGQHSWRPARLSRPLTDLWRVRGVQREHPEITLEPLAAGSDPL